MAEKKETKKTKRPTAQKRDLQAIKRNFRNKVHKSRVHTCIRSIQEGLDAGKIEECKEQLNHLYQLMDKGVKSGVFKKNKASRVKSRVTAKVKAAK
jgi:small subunit ribosomal protein S20